MTEQAFMRDFASDLPPEQARALYAVQWPFHKSLVTGKTTVAAWRSKPSFYAVSTQDRTINPDLERFMAKRMKAHTIELESGHLSLISPRRGDQQSYPAGRWRSGLIRKRASMKIYRARAG